MTAPELAKRPEADESEAQVLGTLLIDAPEAEPLFDLLEPADFGGRAHREVFEAVRAVKAREGVVDQLLVVGEMSRRGTIDRLRGGALGVHDLVANLTTPAAARAHADRVTEAARDRRIMGAIADASESGDWEKAARELPELIASGRGTSEEPTSWAEIDLRDVLAGERPLGPEVLQRADGQALFYRGKIHALYGETESAKSWVSLAAAEQVIAGGGHVVYVDFEDEAAGIVERLRSLGAKDEAIAERFHYVRPDEPLDDAGRRDLARMIERVPELVVLDGETEALTLHGLDLNDNGDVARFHALLPALFAAAGAAVVLIDHVVKSRDGRGRWALGAQHKLAGVTGAAFVLETVRPFGRGLDGLVRMTVTKDRPGHVRGAAVDGKAIAEVFVGHDDSGDWGVWLHPPRFGEAAFRPTGYMERVSRFLEGRDEPASGKTIEDSVGGKHEHVRRALAALVDDGAVESSEGPRRATLYRSLEPFREATP
jgi:hypothetical protein